MRRFITRHSQVPNGSSYNGGHLFPDGETLISELGEEQARLLGERLRDLEFSGVILSSPYVRTMLTAEIIAEIVGAEIIPFAPIHEIFRKNNQILSYKGLSSEELKKTFRHVRSDFELAYPWWPSALEDTNAVQARVDDGVRLAEKLYGNGDILYVGHGASCDALVNSYGIPKKRYSLLFNCALSYVVKTDKKVKFTHCDTIHLPYEKTTSNFLAKRDYDSEVMSREFNGIIELPSWLDTLNGKRVLHIGDTESQNYHFFRALIEAARPDIIIHTGDMADEVKVGRIPETKSEYLHKISVMCDMLDRSSAREIIIVPGNNDIAEDISRLIPRAKICKQNSVVDIDGRECRLSHSVAALKPDGEWCFYGHGFTGDDWNYGDNREGGECRFNACLGATLCSPKEGKFTLIVPPSTTF